MAYPWFQFHKGTSKTYFSRSILEIRKWFQFHKGTSKTLMQVILLRTSTRFNSIKVQVKQEAKKNIVEVMKFQFHKGTSKTNTIFIKKSTFIVSIP